MCDIPVKKEAYEIMHVHVHAHEARVDSHVSHRFEHSTLILILRCTFRADNKTSSCTVFEWSDELVLHIQNFEKVGWERRTLIQL